MTSPGTETSDSTLQHTATDCNRLQQTATHYTTLQHHSALHGMTSRGTETSDNTLQHTATHCNTPATSRSHTAGHVSHGVLFERRFLSHKIPHICHIFIFLIYERVVRIVFLKTLVLIDTITDNFSRSRIVAKIENGKVFGKKAQLSNGAL